MFICFKTFLNKISPTFVSNCLTCLILGWPSQTHGEIQLPVWPRVPVSLYLRKGQFCNYILIIHYPLLNDMSNFLYQKSYDLLIM